MEIFRNGKLIGYSTYNFTHKNDIMEVSNVTYFEVEFMGLNIFKIESESVEKFKGDQLISFQSKTKQNDKNKYVNLNFNQKSNDFIIEGSSFKGTTDDKAIVGNWWNHRLLQANSQISPISGSVKNQVVTFIGKESVEIYNKMYFLDKFSLKSQDEELPNDKKLDFVIWYDSEKNLIRKITYDRMGLWEYKLKTIR